MTANDIHAAIDAQHKIVQERKSRAIEMQVQRIKRLADFLSRNDESHSERVDRILNDAKELAGLDEAIDRHQTAVTALENIDRGE